MLQCTMYKHKSNWNHRLFLALWAYHVSTKNTMGFTPFHLLHGVEYVLPVEC